MKLTRRGQGVVLALVVVIGSGFAFGARGLNAAIVPSVVVFVSVAYQLRGVERPGVERELPDRGERGESVTVRLSFETDTSLAARVHDRIDEGLEAVGNRRDASLHWEALEYDLTLQRRGERSVGPLSIEVRDAFGLLSRTFEYGDGDGGDALDRLREEAGRDTILVHPRVYPLAWPAHAAVMALHGELGDAREEFDYLRSYRRGDPLKDVHWKSSAKHPNEDFVVKEFTADQDSDTVALGVEGTEATMDAVADAAASVAMDVLGSKVELVLLTPSARIDAEDDSEDRTEILDHLARVGAGVLDEADRTEADLFVRGEGGEVRIELDGQRYAFGSLVGSGESRSAHVAGASETADAPEAYADGGRP